MPDFKIGGLVTSEYFEVGLLVAVYDHDTQDPADLSDAKTKLLEAKYPKKCIYFVEALRYLYLNKSGRAISPYQ